MPGGGAGRLHGAAPPDDEEPLRPSSSRRKAEGVAGGRGSGRTPASRRSIDVAGIPVRADASLLVIAGLSAWSFWVRYSTVASRGGALLMALVATLLLLGSILAHELAHALEARRRGLHVGDITLYVFGGATRMTDEAARPGDELSLTVAGPWASIALGCAFGLVATGADHLGLPDVAEVAGELGWLNVVLGIFNLLPGAPLDGGRILDSIVWRVTRDRARAARVSAASGRLIGAGLAAFGVGEMLFLSGGFVGGLWLVLVGWFLLRAAAAEGRFALIRDRLRGRKVEDVVPPVAAVPTGASLTWAVGALRRGSADVVGVAGPEGIVGALTAADLRKVAADERPFHSVDEVMTPTEELPVVQASAPAPQLLPLLGSRPVVVLEGAHVRSLVTPAQLELAVEWLPPLPRKPESWAEAEPDGEHRGADQGGERAPSSDGHAGRRRAGAGLRNGAIVVSGAIVLAAAGVVPMPLIEVSPGPALDVPALLRTDGRSTLLTASSCSPRCASARRASSPRCGRCSTPIARSWVGHRSSRQGSTRPTTSRPSVRCSATASSWRRRSRSELPAIPSGSTVAGRW